MRAVISSAIISCATFLWGTAPLALAQEPSAIPQEGETETRSRGEGATLAPGDYFLGGAVGTVMGFGLGHAIVGEYRSMGWVFSVGEALSLAGYVYGNGEARKGRSHCHRAWYDDDELDCDYDARGRAGQNTAFASLLVFMGFRLWQTYDVWIRPWPRVDLNTMGSVGNARQDSPALEVFPVGTANGFGLGFRAGF